MPSTYSNLLRLTKQATGENDGTWGAILNENVFEMLEDAIAGLAEIDASGLGPYTLTTQNGDTDEARCAVLKFTGTPTGHWDITIPATPKLYIVHNACSSNYNMILKATLSGDTVTVGQNKIALVYTDGTDVMTINQVGDDAIGTSQLQNDAVTNAKLANMANATIKGRLTSGTGDPEDLTGAQANTILPAFTGDSGTGGVKGLVPAPAAGDGAAKKVLFADGTFKSLTSGRTRVYFTTPGLGSWVVPDAVTKVFIVAAGGGGGGHSADDLAQSGNRAGSGGTTTVTHLPSGTNMSAGGGVGGIWSDTNVSAPANSVATGGDFNLSRGGSAGGISGVNGNNAVTNGENGAYCEKTIVVTPDDTISYVVGAGGAKLVSTPIIVDANDGVPGYVIIEY